MDCFVTSYFTLFFKSEEYKSDCTTQNLVFAFKSNQLNKIIIYDNMLRKLCRSG